MKAKSVLIPISARTGLILVYVFCSEISCHLPGNLRDLLLHHQEQPPFATVSDIKKKKSIKKSVFPSHGNTLPQPKLYNCPQNFTGYKVSGSGNVYVN